MSLYNQSSARRSLIDTVLFRALSQAATIIGYVVLVRGMRKEDFGVFNLLYSIIPVVSTIASLGLEQTLRRYQPEYLLTGNSRGAAWLVRFVSNARLGTNLLVIGIVLLAWNHIAPIFQLTPYRGAFMLFALLLLLHFQVQILQMTLASHMLHRYSVGAVVVMAIAKLIAYVALSRVNALTLEHAIIADTIAYALAFTFLRGIYRSRCRDRDDYRTYQPSGDERRRLLRYGLYNNFNDAGTLLLDSSLDNFFIAAIIDPVSVAAYAFYTRLIEMTSNASPLRLFDNVIQPMFFATPRSEADRRVPQYFTLLLNLNFVPQWPVLAFSLAYHAELVTVVFGGKYVEHSWLLPVIMGFSLVNSIGTPVTLVAQYDERAGLMLLSKVTALVNVAAMLLLVPIAGLYGAALARGTSVALKNGFIWWHVRHRAAWRNALPFIVTSVLLWGLVVLVCLGMKAFVPAPPIVQLVLGAGACGCALLLHLRSPAICSSDREMIGSLLHGKEARALRWLGLLPAPGAAGSSP